MVHIDKFIKSKNNKTKIRQLAKQVKHLQALDKTKLSIKKYKKQLAQQYTETPMPTPLPTPSHKIHSNKYIYQLGLNTVSKMPIQQLPTKLDLLNIPIIQPGTINIPDMELIETHNTYEHKNKILLMC